MGINSTNLLAIYKNSNHAPSPPLKTYYLSRRQEAELEAKANKLPETELSPDLTKYIYPVAGVCIAGAGIFLSRKQIMFNPSTPFTQIRKFIAKYLKLNTFRVLRIKDDIRLNKEIDRMRFNEIYGSGNDRHRLNAIHIITEALAKKKELEPDEKNMLFFFLRELLEEYWTASSISPDKKMLSGMQILTEIMRILKRAEAEGTEEFITQLIPRIKSKNDSMAERIMCLDKLMENKLLNEEHIENLVSGNHGKANALEGLISVLRIVKEQIDFEINFPQEIVERFFFILNKVNEKEKYILINSFLNNVKYVPVNYQKDISERFLNKILKADKNNIFDDSRFLDVPYTLLSRYMSLDDADITKFGFKNAFDFYKVIKERYNLLSPEAQKISDENVPKINLLKNILANSGAKLKNNDDLPEFEDICIDIVKELAEIIKKHPDADKKFGLTEFTRNIISSFIKLVNENTYTGSDFADKLHRLYPLGDMPAKIGLSPSEALSYAKLAEQKRKMNKLHHPDNFPYSKIKRMEHGRILMEMNNIIDELTALCKRPKPPEPIKALPQFSPSLAGVVTTIVPVK